MLRDFSLRSLMESITSRCTGDTIATATPALSIMSIDVAGVQGLGTNPLARSSSSIAFT